MFNEIRQFILKITKSRLFVLGAIISFLFFILIVRIFVLQIVNKDYYLEKYILKSQKTIYTAGTRGLIYDRNGEILAYNQLSYAITIEDVLDSTTEKNEILNEIIDKTIKIIEANQDTLVNDFPIILNAAGEYEYTVDGKAKTRFLVNIYGKSSSELSEEGLDTATAKKAMKYLCSDEKYEVSADYTNEEKLKIVLVRYNLSLNYYQKYITTTIAKNVSEETVASIYENAKELTGITVSEQTTRVYDQGEYFAHILGYTGQISENELTELNEDEERYNPGDIIGKSAIEDVMESYLQGTRGEETVFVDNMGKIIESTEKTNPIAGNDVYLTIDKKLQIATYKILEQKLAGILYNKIVNHAVTITEDSKVIYIPVTDVYYQIINNNIVDLTKFSLDSATENEKQIYSKYLVKHNSVVDIIRQNLTDSGSKPLSSLSEEHNTYLSYLYEKLSSSDIGIINTDSIDENDETYIKWTKETISLREFLLYAISKNWINTAKIESFNDDVKYANSDEVYNVLVNDIITNLEKDAKFSKKVYYYLISNSTITGSEICQLLYNQQILEYDESAVNQLSSGGSETAYNFIREQIRLIKLTPAQIALDPCSGSCVVTDTDTGDVLALVTYPSYDNNMLSGTVDAEYWNKLNNDLSLPLYNRATQTRTAPGSTFKMVTAITGLEEGVISTESTITDQGSFEKITPSPKCWKWPSNHGSINVSQALRDSCNYFFYEVGFRLSTSSGTFSNDDGLNKLRKYAGMFGLTQKSGIEIEETKPLFSVNNSVHSSIGQGSNSFTNIQLAKYVNTVANKGSLYTLTLLNKVVDFDGNTIKEYEPKLESVADITESTWSAVHSGMRQVITTGTARNTFADLTIEVAGKSGTAQENKLRSNHSVFVAFAPYTNPEISLSVLLPYGDSSGYAAEIIKEVTKYYFHVTTDEQINEGTASVPESGITND